MLNINEILAAVSAGGAILLFIGLSAAFVHRISRH